MRRAVGYGDDSGNTGRHSGTCRIPGYRQDSSGATGLSVAVGHPATSSDEERERLAVDILATLRVLKEATGITEASRNC